MTIQIPTRYDILKNLKKYERIRILLDSDEAKYSSDTFCLKFPNESKNARDIRKELLSVSFKNIANDLISATKDAIFHEGIRLEFKGGTNPLAAWAQDVTLGLDRTSLLEYCGDVSIYHLRGYGHIWTILDKPNYEAANFADELNNGAPYICNVYPGDVINYELIDGELEWFAYRYIYCPEWPDPTQPAPKEKGMMQTRIWTRTEFIVCESSGKVLRFPHKFGFVPVVYQSFFLPTDNSSILGITPFFATSNMIIFGNNLMSVADLELIKHGTSVLMMKSDAFGAMNVEVTGKGEAKIKKQDPQGYNILTYEGEVEPKYLVKDLQAVEKANTQAAYYFQSAIENERSLQSIFKKRDTVRETGPSRAFDAEPARAGLRATAEDLESWCRKVLNMAARMLGREALVDSFIVKFPERFILTKTLEEKLAQIKLMTEVNYPSITGRKESFKSLTPDIVHDTESREKVNKEIDDADIKLEGDDEKEIMKQVNKELESGKKPPVEDEE